MNSNLDFFCEVFERLFMQEGVGILRWQRSDNFWLSFTLTVESSLYSAIDYYIKYTDIISQLGLEAEFQYEYFHKGAKQLTKKYQGNGIANIKQLFHMLYPEVERM